MAHLNTASSSWVASIEYVKFGEGVAIAGASGFLIVTSRTGSRYAYAVPSWVAGLVAAYAKRFDSPGKAYNRLVRGNATTGEKWLSVKL